MKQAAKALYVAVLAAALWVVALGFSAAIDGETDAAQGLGVPSGVVLGMLAGGGLGLVWALFVTLRGWRRADAGVGLGLRVLFEVLVLASVVYLVWLQPFARPTFVLTAGLATALWGLFLAIADTGRQRGMSSRALAAVELVLFNLCLVAVLAEGATRLWGQTFPSPLFDQEDSRSVRVIKNHKTTKRPGILRFGFPLNSQGYYDTELTKPTDGRRLVASIGDSFSYGVVPHHFHFTTVAERRLGDVDVWNYGFPGIGPSEYLYILETEALAEEPDAVVINLFVGNDLKDAKRSQVEDQELRFWWDRANLLLYQVPRRLAVLRKEEAADPERETPVGSVERRTRKGRIETPEEMIAEYPWLADPSLEEPPVSRDAFLETETERALLICDPETSDYTPLFEALDDIRREVSVPLVVVVIPDQFQIEDAVWQRLRRWTSGRELDRDLPQKKIVPWLEEQGVVHLDLLPLLRERCAHDHRGSKHCYHFRDTHFNARGNRIAGEAIAEVLRQVLGPDGHASP